MRSLLFFGMLMVTAAAAAAEAGPELDSQLPATLEVRSLATETVCIKRERKTGGEDAAFSGGSQDWQALAEAAWPAPLAVP